LVEVVVAAGCSAGNTSQLLIISELASSRTMGGACR
jgi:hypothetical protein